MKVFISSTYVDLKEYRLAAVEVVNRLEFTVLAMEFFLSQAQEPVEACLQKIEECDLFIGIYAHRYGYIPSGSSYSITHQEYLHAESIGKPRLCFIIDPDVPWLPRLIDHEHRRDLETFINLVKTDQVVSTFTSSIDFHAKLSASIAKFLFSRRSASPHDPLLPKSFIPPPPTPYAPHPYALPQIISDRSAERAALSNWYHNDSAPILTVEAIGGMGKSLLTWLWMQEIITSDRELSGSLWWSFYDEPFEAFIDQLYYYLSARWKIATGDQTTAGMINAIAPVLQTQRLLLIMDGYERALRGYSSVQKTRPLESEGFTQSPVSNWDEEQRTCLNPLATRFIQRLSMARTKTVITTRLFPRALEGLSGVKRFLLTGLSMTDAVGLLRAEGIQGSTVDLEAAAKIYECHPLMVKLLCSAMQRTGCVDVAKAYSAQLINREEPQKIVGLSYSLLSERERIIGARLSVLRHSFSLATAQALLPGEPADELTRTLHELNRLGFLFYERTTNTFDYHPIMRSFLYDHLTDREQLHERAIEYFQSLPSATRILSLRDLEPVIELYHHLVAARRLADAFELWNNRLRADLYYRLGAYAVQIEMLLEIVDDDNSDLRLSWRAMAVNSLANCYACVGSASDATKRYQQALDLFSKDDDGRNLAVTLCNWAALLVSTGRIAAAITNAKAARALCRRFKETADAMVCNEIILKALALQGCWENGNKHAGAKALAYAARLLRESNKYAVRTDDAVMQCRWHFLAAYLKFQENRVSMARQPTETSVRTRTVEALDEVCAGISILNQLREPLIKLLITGYWLLGEMALAAYRVKEIDGPQIPARRIVFHDGTSGEPIDLTDATLDVVAEKSCAVALSLCRNSGYFELEPEIACVLLRLGALKKGSIANLDAEALLGEPMKAAQVLGYREKIVNLHLACAEILAGTKDFVFGECPLVLGESLDEHLRRAVEHCADLSSASDLFDPDRGNHYDGVIERKWLIRPGGVARHLRSGYWIGWEIARTIKGPPPETRDVIS